MRRLALGLFAAISLAAGIGQAGQERYDYDPIGRLIRFTDSANQVTDYQYDAAGNILSVSRAGTATALVPVLTGVAPQVVRRGTTQPVVLTGQRLQVGTLQASDPGLDFSNIHQSATQVSATLVVSESAATGTQTLTFSNAQGVARIGLVVAPKLPGLSVEPSPLALPPDNVSRAITVRLSNADAVAHTVNIVSSDPSRATVSPPSLVIAAGQTAVLANVLPKAAGFVNLVLTSPSLGSVTVPVFLTTDFRGVNTSYSMPVGVVVGEVPGTPTLPPVSSTFVSARVGVAVGPVLTRMNPQAVPVGALHNLVIDGAAIPAGVSVSVVPTDSVTATVTSASDNRLQVQLVVGSSAAPGIRKLVVTDASGTRIPFADPQQGQLRLTTGQPGIVSIEPLFAAPGSTMALKIRGSHLQGGLVSITPGIDLRLDNAPAVSC